MSLRAKSHGYTAWVNMRLLPYNHALNNVIMDIMQGTNMKYLIESMTGHEWDKLQTFEKLSREQVQTRVQWIVEELKRYNVIAKDLKIDARMFAIRSAKHVFELLWRLVVHDIWFIWDRIDYLTNQDDQVLLKVPFTWIPASPPSQNIKKEHKVKVSLLSGFAAAPAVREVVNDNMKQGDQIEEYEKFPGFDIMKSYSKIQDLSKKSPPDPKKCIIDIVKIQLKTVPEGKRIHFTKLSELADTRVLCGLVNSFAPNLFPTEIFLNDRWGINLVLRSLDQMLMCKSTMDSEDLTEADPDSICAFLCYLFMTLFKFKQCRIVVDSYRKLEKNIKYASMDLETTELPPDKKYNLENKLDGYVIELQQLKDNYDIDNFMLWIERVNTLKENIHAQIVSKMKIRFDWFPVSEEETSIGTLCLNQAINLSLNNGNGFYQLTYKEAISKERRIILRDLKKNSSSGGVLIEDITNKKKPDDIGIFGDRSENPRKVLNLPNLDVVDIDPRKYPNYEIYVEMNTNNKILLKGTHFMYQIFPTSFMFYHKFLIKACQENELDTVQRLHAFFNRIYPNFINIKEPGTLNTAAHYAANKGFFSILLFLLENHAQINAQNSDGNSPLFSAADTFQRDCAKLLLEFGADINLKNNSRRTVFEHTLGEEFKLFLRECYDRLSTIVPQIVNGNVEILDQVYRQHLCGSYPLCTIRSRFINGSTLLHTSCYFEQYELVERLVKVTPYNNEVVDPNLSDYKGAAPLHRCKNLQIMKILLDYGADINIRDLEGNVPLHVKCYGEKGKPSELKCIELLLNYGADMTARNKKKLMPIHCAAMQGRTDIIEVLLNYDHEYSIESSLGQESHHPASPAYLALINDFKDCALWLVKHAFFLKDGEADTLLYKVLTEQIIVKDSADMINFLCKNGCNLNYKYPGGNSALHYAASMSGDPKALKLLIKLGANVNALNDDMNSPLFMAVLANNERTASTLIANGADVRLKNNEGFTAFDLIPDLEEWIKFDCFDDETKARLKAYNYKHTRDLIRAISEKVKANVTGESILQERDVMLTNILFQHSLMFSSSSPEGGASPRLLYQRSDAALRYSYNTYNR